MAVITLVGWFALYQSVRRFVAYEYRKVAAFCTFAAALCLELWLTQDFFHTIALKFF